MKPRDLIVGLLFFGSVGVALYFAVNLGGEGRIRMPWEAGETNYTVNFAHVQGLALNAQVWVSGVPKGKVRAMYVDPRTGVVEVRISVDSTLRLNSDAYAEIISASVFGGRAIALYLGESPEPHDPEVHLEGRVVEDLFTAAGRGIDRINEGIDLAVDTLKDVNAVVRDVREGRGPVGTILRDEKVAGDISAAAENIRLMSEDGRGITTNFRDITEKISAGDGVASLFLDDADTALRVKNIVRNVEDATDNTVGATRTLGAILDKLNESDGFFSVLLNDPETGENIRRAVAATPSLLESATRATDQVGTLVEGVNRGEGSVGKLFKNDVLFNDTLNAVNTLRAGFEDIREQAPITTFASLLFQVFQ